MRASAEQVDPVGPGAKGVVRGSPDHPKSIQVFLMLLFCLDCLIYKYLEQLLICENFKDHFTNLSNLANSYMILDSATSKIDTHFKSGQK